MKSLYKIHEQCNLPHHDFLPHIHNGKIFTLTTVIPWFINSQFFLILFHTQSSLYPLLLSSHSPSKPRNDLIKLAYKIPSSASACYSCLTTKGGGNNSIFVTKHYQVDQELKDMDQHGETQSSFNFDTEEINWNTLFPSASELLMQIDPWISPYRSRRREFRNLLNQVIMGIPMDDHVCDNTYPMNELHEPGTSSLHPVPHIPPPSSQHLVPEIPPPSVPVQQALMGNEIIPMLPKNLGTLGSSYMEMFGYDAPLEIQQLPRGIFGYHGDSLNWEEGVYPMFDPEEVNWFPNSPLFHGQNLNVSEPSNCPRISSRSIYDPIYEDKGFHEDPFLRDYSLNNNNGTKDEDDTISPNQGQKDLSSGPL